MSEENVNFKPYLSIVSDEKDLINNFTDETIYHIINYTNVNLKNIESFEKNISSEGTSNNSSNSSFNNISNNGYIGNEVYIGNKVKNQSHPREEIIFKLIKEKSTLKSEKIKCKLFKCTFDGCEKSFEYKWILNRHINSHFCFKLFKCEYQGCSKTYKSKENLNLHIKNKHLGLKPYKCRYCLISFSHRNGIIYNNLIGKTYHERTIHINYLPHLCNISDCKLRFASKSALKYHIVHQHCQYECVIIENAL